MTDRNGDAPGAGQTRGASEAAFFLCPIADWARLTGDLLREGKTIRVRVRGASMRPAIRDGDTLHIAPVDPRRIRLGQVVLYLNGRGRPVIHRVVRRRRRDGALHFEIRSDYMPASDGWVPASSILGGVEAIERNGRRFSVQGIRGRLWEWFFLALRPLRPLLSRARRLCAPDRRP